MLKGETWALITKIYMLARINVCFFGRSMEIQWNAQNAKLLDGVVTMAKKKIAQKV
jgi:hypothetical protein